MMMMSNMNEPAGLEVREYDPEWEFRIAIRNDGYDICPICGVPLENGRCPEGCNYADD